MTRQAVPLHRRLAAHPPFARLTGLFAPVGDLGLAENRALQRRRRAALAAMTSVAAKIVSVATQLVTVPITLHYLGAERYGMWLIMSSLVAMLSFADLGIGNGILNTVAAAHARDDRAAIRVAVSSGAVALTAIAVLILVAFALAYPHVAWHRFFNVRTPLARAEAGPAVAAFVLCFALSIPATIVQRVQLGLQEGFLASLWVGAGSLLTLPAILLATYLRAGLPVLVAVFVGVPLLATLCNSLHFFRHRPQLRPSPRLARTAELRDAIGQGLLFVAIQLGNSVTAGCVPIIVAQVIGPQVVPQYAVPERLLALVVMVVGMVAQPLWPAYREAIVRGDTAWVAHTYRRTLLGVVVAAGGVLAMLGLAMPILLHLWVGGAVQPPALLVAGLCVYKLLESVLWVNAMLLNGLHAIRIQAWMAIATAAAYVLTVILVCRFLGLPFVGWASAAVLTIGTLLPGGRAIVRRLAHLDGKPAR